MPQIHSIHSTTVFNIRNTTEFLNCEDDSLEQSRESSVEKIFKDRRNILLTELL
jgi:hypothetical protein